MRQQIEELSSKIQEQSKKNSVLEEVVKRLRNEIDQSTTQMADLRGINEEQKQEILKIQTVVRDQK